MLFLALGLMMSGCTNEEPECTDCLGTFRCQINGEKWTPNCEGGGIVSGWCKDIDCQYYLDTKGLSIWVRNDSNNDRLSFNARGLGAGLEAMPLTNLRREYKDYTRGNCASYDLIQDLPNYIELTALDTVNYTVEGNFAFSVLGRCDGDTLHITDGYFHLSYRF
jgi:hypothetical protein